MGFLSILALAYSFYHGHIFSRRVRASIDRPKSNFKPQVCLIMPCKGLENGLEENIKAILSQEYPHYEVVLVTDNEYDPAYSTAKSILARYHAANARLYIAEPNPKCSGKVAALLTALNMTRGQADAYAFIDSDSLAAPNWLAELVDPLIDPSIGATTGFRWYFPSRGDFWSLVESAWNAAGTSILFDERFHFPWGGATAVRAETLEKIDIQDAWANALSDDIALTLALRRNGYRTMFLPQCVVATHNKTTLGRFLEWAVRQTALTKVLNEGLWWYALVAFGFLDLVFVLGLTSLGLGLLLGLEWFFPAALLLAPSILGIVNSVQRYSAFERALPQFSREFKQTRVLGSLASFLVPWAMTYCIAKSARLGEIEWRGRKYPINKANTLARSLGGALASGDNPA